jgi:hypothetical protein
MHRSRVTELIGTGEARDVHDNIFQNKPAHDGNGDLQAAAGEAARAVGIAATPAAGALALLLVSVGRHLIDPAYDVREVRAGMPAILLPAACDFDAIVLADDMPA